MAKRSARRSVLPRPVADVWSAGLGALGAARKRGAGGFEALVARGRSVQESGEHAAREALDQVDRAATAVADRAAQAVREAGAGAAGTAQGGVEAVVERVLAAVGMPGRDEITTLQRQVDTLHQRLAAFDPVASSALDTAPPLATEAFVVAPHPDGWAVRRDGAARALSVHATKKEATVAGRQTAKAHAPSRLTLHRTDGSAGETVEYDV